MADTKLAFYIELKKHKEVIGNAVLDNGNPGVGGTQYLFLITVRYLNRLYGNGYAVLLSDMDFEIDSETSMKNVTDEAGAVSYCEKHDITVLVLNANIADRVPASFFNTDRKIILWAHNTMNMQRQRIAARAKSIYKVVCVSKSQYENMRDTECFPKCTYVNNIIPESFYKNAPLTDYSEKKAVYVGSATPQKGIHNLIQIWRHVEKLSPDSELYVIGGAKVWNPQSDPGCLGVGDLYYDKIISKKLKGLQHPERVHFLGTKGWEEIRNIISTFRAGIVNPSHYMRDETFCMSAIEMQMHGLPVVSRERKDGLGTTIVNDVNGYLEKSDKAIAEKIAALLNDRSKAEEKGKAAKKFSAAFIAENEIFKWKYISENAVQIQPCKKRLLPSKDAWLLLHDFMMKLGYTLISGKIMKFIRK